MLCEQCFSRVIIANFGNGQDLPKCVVLLVMTLVKAGIASIFVVIKTEGE